MKLVIISDTHGRHEEYGILEGDVLVHCGDVCDAFSKIPGELERIDAWFGKQQFAAILCIGGNHDFSLQRRARETRSVLPNAVYLEDARYEHNGVVFYGAPWVPELSGWAYYKDAAGLRAKWELIPAEVDVLITHTPPFHILDSPLDASIHAGCPFLRQRVEESCPFGKRA